MEQPIEARPMPPACPPPPPRVRGGRVAGYFICLVVLNILLGFYVLYALGLVLQSDWYAGGSSLPIMQTVLLIVLAVSPLLLTILFNRGLYRLFRGRRRFPRGTALLAVLVLLVVQALTIMLTLRFGLVEGATGIGMGDYVQFFSEIT